MNTQYPPGSTAKVYYDADGNERTLSQMVMLEPEWARNRIISGEIAEQQRDELQQRVEQLLDQCLNFEGEAVEAKKQSDDLAREVVTLTVELGEAKQQVVEARTALCKSREMVREHRTELNRMQTKYDQLDAFAERLIDEKHARGVLLGELQAKYDELLVRDWVSVDDEIPAIGEKVILFANGVVHQETFELDAADIGDFHTEYFWACECLDEFPKVESGQFWMRLPSKPAIAKAGGAQ